VQLDVRSVEVMHPTSRMWERTQKKRFTTNRPSPYFKLGVVHYKKGDKAWRKRQELVFGQYSISHAMSEDKFAIGEEGKK